MIQTAKLHVGKLNSTLESLFWRGTFIKCSKLWYS